MADTLDKTIGDRTARYGEFKDHARITQDLKAVMQTEPGWARLAPDQKEALEIVAHKIARILNGDPNYADSWHDIAGYAKLVDDRLVREALASSDKPDNARPTLHLGGQHSILDDSSKHAGQACDTFNEGPGINSGCCYNCGQDRLSHVGQRT